MDHAVYGSCDLIRNRLHLRQILRISLFGTTSLCTQQFLQDTGIVAYCEILCIPVWKEGYSNFIADDAAVAFSAQPHSSAVSFHVIACTFG